MEWDYKLSVVMPVYNGEELVGNAIESVLSQTFNGIELIILNDGSTDGSEKVIEQYLPAPNITYVSHQNRGATETVNRGIKMASGQYLSVHPQDDISRPTRFEKLINVLETNEDVGFAFTPATFIDFDGNELGEWGGWDDGGRISSSEAFYDLYVNGNFLASPGVVFGRRHIDPDDDAPWGDPDLEIVSDWQQWLRALQYSDAYELSEPLIKMLRDPDHDNLASRREQVYEEERLVIERIREQFRDGPHPVTRRYYAMAMSNYYFREMNHRLNDREYLNSLRLILKSLGYNPLNTKLYRKFAGMVYPG